MDIGVAQGAPEVDTWIYAVDGLHRSGRRDGGWECQQATRGRAMPTVPGLGGRRWAPSSWHVAGYVDGDHRRHSSCAIRWSLLTQAWPTAMNPRWFIDLCRRWSYVDGVPASSVADDATPRVTIGVALRRRFSGLRRWQSPSARDRL
jgi:hypothetical protein